MDMLTLETQRLLLKPHTLDNAEKLNAWENDPELLYSNDDQPEDREPDSLEDTRQFLERISEPSPESRIIHYAIHLKENDEMIGYGMIALIDRYNRRCKVGITIGDKRHWGKGLAKEVLKAVISYSFDTLGLNRIGAEVYAFNDRSIRLFEGLGFRREGVVRQSVFKKNQFVDEYNYGLLKSEWFVNKE
jgi:RimJ/RimL family protein N-acetyltransferase